MKRPGAGSALLGVTALVYAVAAVGNGSDRASLYAPAGPVLPAAFKAQVYRQEARQALAEGDTNTALNAAWRAVQAAPIEPGSTALLGATYFAVDQPDRAFETFKVARQFGWRDFSTQAYWVAAGLAFSDSASVAKHLDALMRVAPDQPGTNDVLVRLEGTAKGRQALYARLVEQPGWIDAYARSSADLAPAPFAARLALLEMLKTKGTVASCQRVSDAVNSLAYRQNRFADARRLWAASCQQGPASAVSNGDFARALPAWNTPFDWQLPSAGGVSADIFGGALVARNDNPLPVTVATQYVMLPPGRARVTWTASASASGQDLGRSVSLACHNGLDLALGRAGARGTGDAFVLDVIVPDGCQPQQLRVRVAREQGEVRVDDIALSASGA